MIAAALKARTKQEFLFLLSRFEGTKQLFLDAKLVNSLDAIVDMSSLKDIGINKIYYVENDDVSPILTDVAIFVIRAEFNLMKLTVGHINAILQKNPTCQVHIILVPHQSLLAAKFLEEANITKHLKIDELNLDFMPLDDDVISLELDNDIKSLYVDNDNSSLYLAAKSLFRIQDLCGQISRLWAKGPKAQAFLELFGKMKSAQASHTKQNQEKIDEVFVFDRSVDWITPLCKQLTYHGLVDNFYEVKNNTLTFLESEENAADKIHVSLTSDDPVFTEIRDTNFSSVPPMLHQIAVRLNSDYESRHKAKTVSEIKQFIGKLGTLQSEHKSLQIHTNIAENLLKKTSTDKFLSVLEFQQDILSGLDFQTAISRLEDMVCECSDGEDMLALLILIMQTTSSNKTKLYEYIKREIIQTYGFSYLNRLSALERAGILAAYPGPNYGSIRKFLNLIQDENDTSCGQLFNIFSGIVPLSIRIIENMLQCCLDQQPERSLSRIPADENIKAWMSNYQVVSSCTPQNQTHSHVKKIIVLFIGGITYGEIAALRQLATDTPGIEIIIATTQILNVAKLLKQSQ